MGGRGHAKGTIMWRSVLPLGLCLLAASAAGAEDLPTIGPRTLAAIPQGEERCYRASFDAAALAAHKGQIVRSFQLYRLMRPNPMKEAIDRDAAAEAAADKEATSERWADVVADLGSPKGLYSQTVVCNDSESTQGFHCYVECDGGGFDVTPLGGGLRLDFARSGGLSLNLSCGDPDEEGHDHWLTGVEAGGGFSLQPEAPEACVADDQAARPAFAADPVPLRQRIADKGWTCLSRRYDAAHLAKHPKQKVAAIALAVTAEPKVHVDEDGWRSTDFPAVLSLRMRDGKSGSREVECSADEYQFRCGGAFRLRRNGESGALLLAGEYGGEGAETPEELAGLKLGLDDLVFRLDGSRDAACGVK
jgi:hypothetical protein